MEQENTTYIPENWKSKKPNYVWLQKRAQQSWGQTESDISTIIVNYLRKEINEIESNNERMEFKKEKN